MQMLSGIQQEELAKAIDSQMQRIMDNLGRRSPMKIIVYHSGYGCETGCCGHVIEDCDTIGSDKFEFTHPSGADPRAWAEDLVRENTERNMSRILIGRIARSQRSE